MILRKFFGALLLLLVLGIFCTAQQQVEVKKVPIKNVPAMSGEKMYVTYCAACHGADGRGAGPAAKALNTSPTDLTLLAQRNKGKFPENHIYQTILGDPETPAHGNKDMPVWGSLFFSLCTPEPSATAEVHQRASVLTKYVASLQK